MKLQRPTLLCGPHSHRGAGEGSRKKWLQLAHRTDPLCQPAGWDTASDPCLRPPRLGIPAWLADQTRVCVQAASSQGSLQNGYAGHGKGEQGGGKRDIRAPLLLR